MNEFEAIYAVVRQIPRGRVMSYGEVGALCGQTARTVGWAMSQAPVDVPWQRVVGADGYLRTARRSPALGARQRDLLTQEGILVDQNHRVPPRFFIGLEDDVADADNPRSA